MRKRRVLGPPGATYHCISRVYDRKFLLRPAACKKKFREIMLREAEFRGVEILTYCIMDNHWHIQVTVPPRPNFSDAELAARYRIRYGPDRENEILATLRELRGHGSEKSLKKYRNRLLAQLHDLSQFMKALKQNFSNWYNRRHGRKGTLWEKRFTSVLVEGRGEALKTIAAYIDLNPVRAGMVSDPKDFGWSGYGAAVGGNKAARAGIATIMSEHASPSESLAAYRLLIFGAGEEKGECGERSRIRKGFTREEAARVYEAEGRLTFGQLMSCRVRYLVDGAILGSRDFVERMYKRNRKTLGRKRKTIGTKVPLTHANITSLRNFSHPLE